MRRDFESVYNLFIFLEGDEVDRLGVVSHQAAGSDADKVAFLQELVAKDFGRVGIYPVPKARLLKGLNLENRKKFDRSMLEYLMRTGNVLRLFDDVFHELDAPMEPLKKSLFVSTQIHQAGK